MTTKISAKETAKQEAIAELRKFIKPGDTIYTVLRSVSSSGMSRQISLFVVKDGEMYRISHTAAKALGYTLTDKNPGGNWAIKVSGAGMDMGFHLVYNLGHVLFERTDEQKDPGYLLNNHWL